jgi:hypothetical protein
MRTHRVFPALQPWLWRTDLVRDLVGAEHLTVARIEAVTRGREPAAFVDLHFTDGERAITVPLVYVDLAQLDVRESDPLVFPNALLGVVPDARAREVVERLYAELERRAMTGGFWGEEIIRFAPAPVFDRARERGFFGAAPLAVSLPIVAGAVYARRFAVAKHVVAYGRDAAQAAAFVRGGAQTCGIIDDASGDDARAWYGEFDQLSPEKPFDLAVGFGPPPVRSTALVRLDAEATGTQIACAAPLPADVMLAFTTAAAGATNACTVVSLREPFARVPAALEVRSTASGSAGRIALAVRPDAGEAPDADTDEATVLAQHLRNEGFTATIVDKLEALAAFAPDLVHLFGVRPGAHARGIAEWANANRKPLVVHALHEAPAAGSYWGAMVAPYCFAYSADDRSVGTYLELLGRRAVEVDGVSPSRPYAPAIVGLGDSERVLAMADVVLVNSERERAVVDAFRARRPTFVVPPLPVVSAAPGSCGAITGPDPFMLVHAPIWAEANQLMLARAAAGVGAPIVFAGPIADPSYAERLREFAPAVASIIAEPAPDVLAALYRSASVVALAGWTSRGHSRLMTASALGAAIVCSNSMWLDLPPAGRWVVDPANVQNVAQGLGGAWDAAVRGDASIRTTAELARTHLQSAAGAIVSSYAKIVQAV